MKKPGIFILSLLAFVFLIREAYWLVMPSVIVENLSLQSIKMVRVALPNNTLVFGPLENGSIQVIYYSLNQEDGVYKYHIDYSSGEHVNGECGYITNNEIGKSYLFTIRPNGQIACNN